MAKECIDCLYAKPANAMHTYHCTKKNKKVDAFANACSQFVSDSVDTCDLCEYSEKEDGIFTRKNGYYCKRLKKRVFGDTVACDQYVKYS